MNGCGCGGQGSASGNGTDLPSPTFRPVSYQVGQRQLPGNIGQAPLANYRGGQNFSAGLVVNHPVALQQAVAQTGLSSTHTALPQPPVGFSVKTATPWKPQKFASVIGG